MTLLSVPFLTDVDPRAEVKGSRDPLGIQSIWTRLGRHVVGNLTTVTTSVRDFTTLMLGYYVAEMGAEERPGSQLGTFLKWEQLAAYARGTVNGDWAIRGRDRTRANARHSSVKLSADPRDQILSNQQLYGIWGLYSVAGRASGLLEGEPARVTEPVRRLIEQHYLPPLRRAAGIDERRIAERLAHPEVRLELTRSPDDRLIRAVANLLKQSFTSTERAFYREHLVFGGPADRTGGRQRQLAELLEPTLTEPWVRWSVPRVLSLAKEAKALGPSGAELALRLERIGAAERVLAPAAFLFSHLLGCDTMPTRDVASRLKHPNTWGRRLATINTAEFGALKAEIGAGDNEAGQRWCDIGEAMAEGGYEQLIALLVEQNKAVMQARGGAAWIEAQDGRLQVRVMDEGGDVPGRDELDELWWSPYFLNSLCAVSYALKEERP